MITKNKQITYTFTDYVDKYENIKAHLKLTSYIDKSKVQIIIPS